MTFWARFSRKSLRKDNPEQPRATPKFSEILILGFSPYCYLGTSYKFRIGKHDITSITDKGTVQSSTVHTRCFYMVGIILLIVLRLTLIAIIGPPDMTVFFWKKSVASGGVATALPLGQFVSFLCEARSLRTLYENPSQQAVQEWRAQKRSQKRPYSIVHCSAYCDQHRSFVQNINLKPAPKLGPAMTTAKLCLGAGVWACCDKYW